MEIIKEAFDEGRETTTEWDKSKAKKNQVKLEVATENLSLMKKREFHSVIPLHQICPDTGKVLRTFQSRIAAARYIVSDILKRPEKNPLSITGNLEMCMRAGWRAYGFYWKIATEESKKKYDKTPKNAKKVFIATSQMRTVYPSIQAAADAIGATPDIVRSAMRFGYRSPYVKKNYIVQEYVAKPKTMTFDTIVDAAKYASCSFTTMARWVDAGKPVNNITYKVISRGPNKVTDKYTVYRNNKIVARCKSYEEIAKLVGGHRTNVSRKVKENKPLGEFGQYRVVVKA